MAIIYDLSVLNRSEDSQSEIEYGIERAVNFRNVYDGIVKTTKTIHGFPKIFKGGELSELSIYIGRSSPSNILGRFIGHRNAKGVHYGAIIGLISTDKIEGVEDLLIKLIMKLKKTETLCVGDVLNIAKGSFGPLPNDDESIIYVCFSFNSNGEYHGLPSPSDLATFASEIAEETTSDVTPRSLREAITVVRQRASVIASRMHPDHL
jgi:hypothetical protein